MRGVAIVVVAACWACGGDDGGVMPRDAGPDATDANVDAAGSASCEAPSTCVATEAPTAAAAGATSCNPQTQAGCAAGEKCTWIQTSSSTGYVGCVPAGEVAIGCACSTGAQGATGYDDCVAGAVCARGECRALCNSQDGSGCDAVHACVPDNKLFNVDPQQPPLAGVCDRACDPLTDNDFLGSGASSGSACACASGQGCFGFPSYGTAPTTRFVCDVAFSTSLVHRSPVPGPAFINSCAEGYLPLLVESTGSSQIICVALCKPVNCWTGNCGTNNDNRLGVAPDRCNDTDRRGTFDTSPGGEHCQFLWRREIDPTTKTFLPSAYSNTVGVCFDHSKYLYDSNSDNMPDAPLPACADLQDGLGSGTDASNPLTYFGAVDLGCVDFSHAQAHGKPRLRAFDEIRLPRGALSAQ